jgi:hypothetical protein
VNRLSKLAWGPQSGSSLVSVLVAVGLSGMAVYGVMRFANVTVNGAKSVDLRQDKMALRHYVRNFLAAKRPLSPFPAFQCFGVGAVGGFQSVGISGSKVNGVSGAPLVGYGSGRNP